MLEEVLGRLSRIDEKATVRTVFGEPIHQNGRVIIPVAKVAYGFGFGGGRNAEKEKEEEESNEGAGGGGGVSVGAGRSALSTAGDAPRSSMASMWWPLTPPTMRARAVYARARQ